MSQPLAIVNMLYPVNKIRKVQSNPADDIREKDKHSRVWSKIAQRPLPSTWMLLGPRLQSLYDGEDLSGKMVYLALVCLDFVGDLQYDYSLSDLRAALVPHEYDEATCEAKLNESSIVVNIWSWAKGDDATAVTDLYSTLLLRNFDSTRTYLMLNHNESMQPGAMGVWMIEYWEVCTVMTEEQHFLDGAATLARRRNCRIDVPSPIGRSWCFFEWDGQRSVDGLGRFNWLLQSWTEHKAHMKYGPRYQ